MAKSRLGRDVEKKSNMASTLSDRARTASIDCIPLDLQFLNENTFGDKGLRGEILSLFRAQLQSVDESLRKAMDQKAWKYMTHTLKGAASAVGAKQIAQLSARWEQDQAPVTSQQISVCCLTFADVVFEFETACAALGVDA